MKLNRIEPLRRRDKRPSIADQLNLQRLGERFLRQSADEKGKEFRLE